MKDYIKDKLVHIFVNSIGFIPKLRNRNYNDLFHISSWECPEDGEIIIVEYEDHSKEILRMNSNVDTDEIIGWCYLNDII